MKKFAKILLYLILTFIVFYSCQKEPITKNNLTNDITDTINNNISDSIPEPTPKKYITENVIVVVIDGARYSETWGDPTHQHIPRMANNLASYGVISTEFYNNGPTYTQSGHTSITTGYYQEINNSGKETPKYPSYFQYWNKEQSNYENLSWIITSKDKLETLKDCQLEEWKGKYKPSTDCGINGIGTGYRDDKITVEVLTKVLDDYEPNLVLVNFRDPDYSGHTGDWDRYINAIEKTDEYAYQIWEYIQQDPDYKDKTTLFITNDHGRHLDNVADGFVSHGCGCEGCRHINFYAFGPDFKKSKIIDTDRELIDISATIAELLDFEVDYSDGEVMYELFK